MKTTHIPARSEGAFTGRIRWSTQKIGQKKTINTIFQKVPLCRWVRWDRQTASSLHANLSDGFCRQGLMNSSTLQINPINDSNRQRLIDDVLYSVPLVRIRPTDSEQTPDILRPARSGGKRRWAAVRCSATFTQGYRRRGEAAVAPKNRCSGLSNQCAQGILTLKALQGIQGAAAGLRMREGRNCACRHIAAAISPPPLLSASGSPA